MNTYPYAEIKYDANNFFKKWEAWIYIGRSTTTHYGFYWKDFRSEDKATEWAIKELQNPRESGREKPYDTQMSGYKKTIRRG